MRSLALLTVAGVMLATTACDESTAASSAPAAPKLVEVLPKLTEVAKQAPPAPAADRQAQLKDLVETAFVAGRADGRLQEMARKDLLDDPDAQWALEDALEHQDSAVRSNAAFQLGELGKQCSLIPLAKRLKYEMDPEAKVWAAAAMAKLGSYAGLPTLIDAMNMTVAQTAGLQSIDICKRAGIELPDQPTYDELRAFLRDLYRGWQRTGAVPNMKDGTTATPQTEGRIAERLLHLPDFQLRPVDDTRYIVARLGQLGLPLLKEALHAKQPYLRMHTVEIVYQLGPVAHDLGNDVLPLVTDELTSCEAARALGAIHADGALAQILPMLHASDAEERAAAAEAIGLLGDPGGKPALQKCFDDPNETLDVRVRAAYGLALFELDRPAYHWMRQLRNDGKYHRPTMDELIDDIDTRVRDDSRK